LETKKTKRRVARTSRIENTLKAKRVIIISALIAVLFYGLSYVWFRQTRTEIWKTDGNAYVIFPDDKVYLYYFYRPLSYVDGAITGMRFHIGQHR
jgi:hypothetical protein